MKRFNSRKPFRRNDRAASNKPIEKDPAKVDQNVVLNSFEFLVAKAKPGEGADQLVRRFKRMVEQSGLLGELRKREAYIPPAEKKRGKKARAARRFLQNKAKRDAKEADGDE